MTLRYLFPHTTTVPYKSFKKKLIDDPQTIGEKLRSRRLELGLLQKDVAKIIGVCEDSITGWENNRGKPYIRHYPKIIQFLDYFPFEVSTSTLAGRIKKYRFENGLSQEDLAKELNVNESTVHHYEKGIYKPTNLLLKKLLRVLNHPTRFS